LLSSGLREGPRLYFTQAQADVSIAALLDGALVGIALVSNGLLQTDLGEGISSECPSGPRTRRPDEFSIQAGGARRRACRAADDHGCRAEHASGRHDPARRGRILRVVQVRDDDADQPPVLVVEDMSNERLAQRAHRA
jgi:hypothetical protein